MFALRWWVCIVVDFDWFGLFGVVLLFLFVMVSDLFCLT